MIFWNKYVVLADQTAVGLYNTDMSYPCNQGLICGEEESGLKSPEIVRLILCFGYVDLFSIFYEHVYGFFFYLYMCVYMHILFNVSRRRDVAAPFKQNNSTVLTEPWRRQTSTSPLDVWRRYESIINNNMTFNTLYKIRKSSLPIGFRRPHECFFLLFFNVCIHHTIHYRQRSGS